MTIILISLPWKQESTVLHPRVLLLVQNPVPHPLLLPTQPLFTLQAELSLEPIHNPLSSKDAGNFCLFSPLLLDPKKDPKAKKCCFWRQLNGSHLLSPGKKLALEMNIPAFHILMRGQCTESVTSTTNWVCSTEMTALPCQRCQSDGELQPLFMRAPCLMGRHIP